MAEKRIYEYTDSLGNNPDYYFAIDRVNNATGKISYADMGKQLTTDIEKARTWILDKVDDDTFSLNTVLFNDSGVTFDLVDQQIIKINPLSFIGFAWQPNANPKISINGSDSIDVYNGFYYNKYGITGLDRNTFWDRGMYFVYDATLNVLLCYKEQMSSGDYIKRGSTIDLSNQESGVYLLNGTTPTVTAYPVLTEVLAQEGFGEAMPNMANTCFVGRNDTYAIKGVVSEGSVPAMSFNVDYSGYFYTIYDPSVDLYGFKLETYYDRITIHLVLNPRTITEYIVITNLLNPPSTLNLTIPSGSQTLTRRRGMYISRVL